MANAVTVPLRVTALHLKSFRCFKERIFDLDAPVVFIAGLNGTGKTTIVEALHYGCYIRSFRTAIPRELPTHDERGFFIKITVGNRDSQVDTINVGSEGSRRLVRVNNQVITSHKDLFRYYKAITITEDDLEIIRGGPTERRAFFDQAILLMNPDYVLLLRKAKATLESRNASLQAGAHHQELYEIWTKQLWDYSCLVQEKRISYLQLLALEVKDLIHVYFNGLFSVQFSYKSKYIVLHSLYADFFSAITSIKNEELRLRRSLFGFHLDDVTIFLRHRDSRQFASRGQQKLLVLLMKVAQVRLVKGAERAGTITLLIDDFASDLDGRSLRDLFYMLCSLHVQLLFTSPVATADDLLARVAQDTLESSSVSFLSLD